MPTPTSTNSLLASFAFSTSCANSTNSSTPFHERHYKILNPLKLQNQKFKKNYIKFPCWALLPFWIGLILQLPMLWPDHLHCQIFQKKTKSFAFPFTYNYYILLLTIVIKFVLSLCVCFITWFYLFSLCPSTKDFRMCVFFV